VLGKRCINTSGAIGVADVAAILLGVRLLAAAQVPIAVQATIAVNTNAMILSI